MDKSVLAFVNALLKMVDNKWQPTDDIPAILVEAIKDLLPIILPLVGAFRASAVLADAQAKVESAAQ